MKPITDAWLREQTLNKRLKGVTFFNELQQTAPEELKNLLNKVDLYTADANEIILQQGDPASALYFLLEGELSVQRLPILTQSITQISAGEMLGAMGMFTNRQRSASLRVSSSRAVILEVDYSLLEAGAESPLLSTHTRLQLFRHMTASLRWNLEKLRMTHQDDGLSQAIRKIPLYVVGGIGQDELVELEFLRNQAQFMATLLSEWSGRHSLAG
ncbi:MAG: cyclic nucleotide-binding domain-containing protein [Oceanobacter sp.]